MTDVVAETPPIDKLAKVYLKIRTRIAEVTAAYDTEIEGLKAQQDELKRVLKDTMRGMNVTSLKTEVGTVILGETTRYNAQDWDTFKGFVKEHDALDLFEKRIAQTNMKTFLEANPGIAPPGLNSMTEYTVSVRKPSAK